jgi:tRNA A22 N-methylase
MGSLTMLSLLRESLPCPLVLSTHIAPEELRSALPGMGYAIRREKLIQEGRRFYVAMLVSQGEDAPCAGPDAYIGRGLLGDPLLSAYLAWKEGVIRKILAERGALGSAAWEEKLRWIHEAQRDLQAAKFSP